MAKHLADETDSPTVVLTFLIADVRGYSRFTSERGDAAAAILAKRFADLARDTVEARSGRVVELRGDEVFAVFDMAAQAVRAALELQATCAEESEADPAFPLPVGIGIDSGEAVPVEDGYRGVALNMAARLCSNAAAGQVLVTRTVVQAVEAADDEVTFLERGPATFKGFEQAIDVIEAVASESPRRPPLGRPAEQDSWIPPELDHLTPLIDRDHEMRWLRGTWRQVRRGRGRLLFVSGPAQIGKTRLAGEMAGHVQAEGGLVRYAGPGGAATAMALSAIRAARARSSPTLLVLDEVDVGSQPVTQALASSFQDLSARPVLILALFRDPATSPDLSALIAQADERGDGHRALGPLDLDGVRDIVHMYAGEDTADVPVESMARASQGVPGRVHEVAGDWARTEASRRLAAAAEFLAAGRDRHASDLEFANNAIGLKLGRLYSVEDRDVVALETCPYKGLAPFEEADSAFFFGRERLVGELAARTVQVGMLGVVGASGSGKSSVVSAGLLPSLAVGLLPGSEQWRQVTIRPGEHPMENLDAALRSSDVAVSPYGDPRQAALGSLDLRNRLVLVVDQFEEVFTTAATQDERDAFVGALVRIAQRVDQAVIVLTLRGDFYDRCASYPELATLLAANHVLVGPMSAEELRRAIELPARRVGIRVETPLTEALVGEVADEPGGLPLLSTALVELWGEREAGWLRMEAYARTGGVRGAVARLAEASFGKLQGGEPEAARAVLLRLVGEGEGESAVKRRVPASEFDDVPAVRAVLSRFTADRLLTASEGMVEVAHEALIREWPRLLGWLEEDVQGRQIRSHITQATGHWAERDKDPAELYRGARLSATLDWAARHGRELNELERAFLSESRGASEAEAQRQRRTNRRLRGLLAGVAVFLVVALVAGGLALVQRGQAKAQATLAKQQARLATARELASAAVASLGQDAERSLLLALRAVEVTYRADRTVLPEAEQALHWALQARRPALTIREGSGRTAFALSPDGRRLLVAHAAGPRVDVYDAHTGQRVMSVEAPEDQIPEVTYSSNGRMFATSSVGGGGRTRVWDAATGRQIRNFALPDGTPLCCLSTFTPDGRYLATPAFDGTTYLWDTRSGKRVNRFDGTGSVAFSPDGRRMWLAERVLDWRERGGGRETLSLFGQKGAAPEAVWSPNGRMIATLTAETVAVWDARAGRRLYSILPPIGSFASGGRAVDFSPDSRHLATGMSNGTTIVWDLSASGAKQHLTLVGHEARVGSVEFGADGTSVATGSPDGTVKIYDVSASGDRERLTVPGSTGVAYSSDGRLLATGSEDGPVNVYDETSGRTRLVLRGHTGRVEAVDFNSDGSNVASAGSDGTIRIWDLASGAAVTTMHEHAPDDPATPAHIADVKFSPDGKTVASTSVSGSTRLWDVATGTTLRIFENTDGEPAAGGSSIDVSPDGTMLAGQDSGSTYIWRIDDGRIVARFDDPTLPTRVAFGADGRHLATASNDGSIRLWDVSSRRKLVEVGGTNLGQVFGLAFSPDGSQLASIATDGTVRLWDGRSLAPKIVLDRDVLPGPPDPYDIGVATGSIQFSPAGTELAETAGDGSVRVNVLPIEELIDVARARLTRTWTPEECRIYLHLTRCPSQP